MPAPQAAQDAAVRELFLAHGGSLLSYLSRLVNDFHRREDAVQETMLRAHVHADRLWPDDRARRAWLFRVGRNVAIDQASSASQRIVPMGDVEEFLTGSTADPAPELVTRLDVARAIRKLSPAQRRVVFEVYYQGHTVASAAATLGVSPSTASTHLSMALRRLKSQLAA
jgi:RNA polymerase sigma-70 factor (ECF subfamily)